MDLKNLRRLCLGDTIEHIPLSLFVSSCWVDRKRVNLAEGGDTKMHDGKCRGRSLENVKGMGRRQGRERLAGQERGIKREARFWRMYILVLCPAAAKGGEVGAFFFLFFFAYFLGRTNKLSRQLKAFAKI